MEEEHVSLDFRKFLIAHVLYYKALQKYHLDVLLEKNGGESLVAIEDLIHSASNLQLNAESDSIPLSTFLSDFVDGITPTTNYIYSLNRNKKLNQLIDDYTESTKKIRCSECHPNSICMGSEDDHWKVANDGACMQYFLDIFNTANIWAKELYQKHSNDFPDNLPGLVFSTYFCRYKPHDIPIECFIGGATKYGDHRSKIKLIFNNKQFSRNCFFAVPYVLLHECIAHAYSAILLNNGSEYCTEPNDPFDEGWMDFCAFTILNNSKKSHWPNSLKEFMNDYKKMGQKFHMSRSDYLNKNSSKFAIQIALGIRAAKKTFNYFKQISDSDDEALSYFFGFSFDFNIGEFSREDRRSLVTMCDNQLPESWDQPLPSYYNSNVYEIFKNYQETKDIITFFHRLKSIDIHKN